jgi:hypothetical protein
VVDRSVRRTSDENALRPMIGNSPGEFGSAVLQNVVAHGASPDDNVAYNNNDFNLGLFQ